MGLFDRKNSKNSDMEALPQPQEGQVEVNFPIVTVVIEEVLSMTSTEVSAIGNVRGGTLKKGDRLYLLGRKGKSTPTYALRIEDAMMSKMPSAEEGTNVSIVLGGLRQGEVEKYDVLSTANCMVSDVDSPDSPVNPYLSGLLRESKNFREDKEFMGRLMEYIANEAIFLTPCMKAPGKEGEEEKVGYAFLKSKDEKMYLAAFTDIHELQSMEGLPAKEVVPVDFAKIMMIIEKSPANGILINPKTDGFAMQKPFLEALLNHKRKMINNIKEQRIDPKQPMAIAIPKEDHLPSDMFKALRDYMATEPSIQNAWYGMMIFPKTQEKAHLIIIGTLEETPEIFGAVGRTAKPFLEDVQLNMQAASKVGAMTEKLLHFYNAENPEILEFPDLSALQQKPSENQD